MNLVHLTASTFFGGPERQMLGLALALPEFVRTTFSTFSEGGRGGAFLSEVRAHGFATAPLKNDFPKVFAAVREVSELLRATACDVLICHGYKAHVLGRLAARRVGVPAVAVSRGWTGETRKVRAYEWIDRRHMQFMDHVVCVSEGQAEKVRRWCRVPSNRLTVIRNSARLGAFERVDPGARARLVGFFGHDTGVSQIIVGAGRFSPEKGFGVLVEAARSIIAESPSTGVVLFGEGQLRGELEHRIAELGLTGRVVLPGFRTDLDALISNADVVVLPSYTEGLPNVALEASAAGVPVVATAVGGTPEAIADNINGFLVPPGSPADLANKVGELLRDAPLRARFGAAGRARMRELFTFEAQATAYLRLLNTLRPTPAEVVA
ncbi:glycosyltransferase [Gemmata sp. G18]|uniref:Glycosyltransferase n=1 Tax=Gemmata palustris TaxID=2822762 RepID=A0ABS5BJW2_9BACT|nr:glycosyltransferase [Gemmata palustris]MBP3953984.1 glycosyltransferase [Gemmata palustris]